MAAISNSKLTVPALQYRIDHQLEPKEIFVPSHKVCFRKHDPASAVYAQKARNVVVKNRKISTPISTNSVVHREVNRYLTTDIQVSKELADLAKRVAELKQQQKEAEIKFTEALEQEFPSEKFVNPLHKQMAELEQNGCVSDTVIYDEATDKK